MSLSWDTTRGRIQFARWKDGQTGLRLYAVAEQLPDGDGWDWAVWLPDEPKLARRGVARSALEAASAAGEAAEQCFRLSGWNPGRE